MRPPLPLLSLGLVLLALTGSCVTVDPVLPEGVKAESAAGIYHIQCARCHDPERVGRRPSRLLKSPELSDAKRLDGLGRDYLRKIISGGGRLVGRKSAMPAAKNVTPKQVEELVTYLLAGKG